MSGPRFIRITEVTKRTGLSVPTIYRLIKLQKFPAPVHVGLSASRWVEDEIDSWSERRIAERDRKLTDKAIGEAA